MGVNTPTALFPSFAKLCENNRLIEGVLYDLGNDDSDYLAGKIVAPVAFPQGGQLGEMNIDGRALHGMITRMSLWGAYGTGRKTSVAFGERAVPVEGRELDPLIYNGEKLFASYKIPVEKVSEIEEWGIDAFKETLDIPRRQLLIDREVNWANLFSTTANWSTTLVAGKTLAGSGTAHPWDTSASNPVHDIQLVRAAVDKFGRADTMILGVDAANVLVDNSAFNTTRQLTVDRAILTEDQLAEIIKARFGFDNVYIGHAVGENSTVPGTSSTSTIWGSTVWIGRLGETPRATSGGAVTARRSAVVNVVAQQLYADVVGPKINAESDDSYIARVRMIESLNVVYPQLGATITGILS